MTTTERMRAWIQDSEGIEKLRTDLIAKPSVEPRDLLIRVRAVATNPVDCKIAEGYNWGHVGKLVPAPNWTVGWDGAGVVEAVGDKVERFQVGDEVYFSGDVRRSGCFAEYCLVDERITGRKPRNLSFEEAAAIPLTFLTAWEGLEEGFNLQPDKKPKSEKTLLVVGGAGGVGSAVIQVAKRVFGLKVIATASREETITHCKQLGADYVINHHKLQDQLRSVGYNSVDYVFNTRDATSNWKEVADCLGHLGKMVVIIGLSGKQIDLSDIWFRRITLFPELMFSRPMFMADDDYTQADLLDKVAEKMEKKELVSTQKISFSFLNLPAAIKEQDAGKLIGKQTSLVEFEESKPQ